MTGSPLRTAIVSALVRHKNAKQGAAMQASLKSPLPCYGVPIPVLRPLCAEIFGRFPISMAADWRRAVTELWDHATHREERYAAIELAAHPPYQRFISLALLPVYRRMIQDGASIDLVDPLAQRVAVLLATYPDRIKPTLRAWARYDNIWLRRVAIISQAAFKDETDTVLLYDCITPSLTTAEPFLRKAIGWALREFARTNPAEVKRYLAAEGAALPPALQKEALKAAPAARTTPAKRPVRRAK